jgi:hypothetical protein
MLFLIGIQSKGQHPDLITFKAAKLLTQKQNEASICRGIPYQAEDTSLHKTEQFHAAYRNLIAFQDFGFQLSPTRDLQFGVERSMGFQMMENPYQLYYKLANQTNYYQTKVPYADFNYAQGPNSQLNLDTKFAVNLTPRLNIGVDYSRILNLGNYMRQFTSGYFTQAFGSYISKSNRYRIIGSFNWNMGVHDENGGITSDSTFEQLTGTNKSVAIQLKGSQSRFKSYEFYGRQFYYLGKKSFIQEAEDSFECIDPRAYFSHSFRYKKDGLFFDNTIGDSSATLFPGVIGSALVFNDSMQANTVQNRFSTGVFRKGYFSEIGFTHELFNWNQHGIIANGFNVLIDGSLEKRAKAKNDIGFTGNAQLNILGYNLGDFKLKGELTIRLFGQAAMVGFEQLAFKPNEQYLNFFSNAFNWENSFKQMQVSKLYGGIQTTGFRHNFTLQLNSFILNNWVYLNDQNRPIQSNRLITVNNLVVSKTFQWGILFLDQSIMLQQCNTNTIQLPEFAAKGRWYLNGRIFKKVLLVQAGIDFWYNSSFYGNDWNPLSKTFYLQRNTPIGNYPMVDLFICGQVKKAVLFAKLEHANMDVFKGAAYASPHYPFPTRAFKLGIKWRMYQ